MMQSGYAILFSLFVLLGASGIWFAGYGVQQSSRNPDRTVELEQAKQALISYAVNYVDHYGPQGAGIAHFPCPDTDKPDPNHDDPWVRDGPNPPCGRQRIAHAWLPRHVNTASGRFHFHNRYRQQLWYAVSDQFINNPLNRVVNPAVGGDISIGGVDDIIAVITAPATDVPDLEPYIWWEARDRDTSKFAYTLIRTSDIKVPAMQRTADWLQIMRLWSA